MVTKEGYTKGKPLANQLHVWLPRDTQRENPLLPIMVTKEGYTKGKPLANQLWSPRDTQRENPLLPIMVTVNIGFSIETTYSLTMPLIGLTESLGNPVEPS